MRKGLVGVAVGAAIVVAGACGGGSSEDDDASVRVDVDSGGSRDGGSPASDAGTTRADAGSRPGRPPPGAVVDGCGGARLYELPADPSALGPWPVGAREVQIGRLRVEVWYPAVPGSDAGAPPIEYDLRKVLPPSEERSIPAEDNPFQRCDCHRDLPLDTNLGPYPVIVFVHGTAAFRTQSMQLATHWASRGFVVVAADHPGLMLGDSLAQFCNERPSGARNLTGDVDAILDALRTIEPEGPVAFLAGEIDASRVGLIGHSAGGNTVSSLADRQGVRVVVPLAASGTTIDGPDLEAILYMGGTADAVVRYNQTQGAYRSSPGPKALVGIRNAGHLAFSDICSLENGEGQNLVEVAQEHEVCGTQFASFLFDCRDSYVADAISWNIVRYATSAVLERVLQCAPTDRLSMVDDVFGEDVSEFQSE